MTRGVLIFIGLVLIASVSTLLAFEYQAPEELMSPADRITQDQIHIYPDRIVIDIEGASWSKYADTNSMDPFLDIGANGLEIVPESEDDLFIGDIVAYETDQGLIVHRIVDIEEINGKKYFTLKGDNNSSNDPEKVPFEAIKYVTIGIIY